ncbi:hypothetical protein B296_00048559 [Ensete ventricosum]|uniref:Uncharacterized protein n=1 Tax=Ensete ventricosum TaxID=4639 RepID=A0A426XXK6_ENSVE|nr:hypothetical protein B296_00048559 [Ensete ventricosum]
MAVAAEAGSSGPGRGFEEEGFRGGEHPPGSPLVDGESSVVGGRGSGGGGARGFGAVRVGISSARHASPTGHDRQIVQTGPAKCQVRSVLVRPLQW